MKPYLNLLFLTFILWACETKNKVHDPEIFYLDTGGDYYYLENGDGPQITEGYLAEVTFESLNEMGEGSNQNQVHRDFEGIIRLENVHNREYRELYSYLKVGDKVIATFSKGSSVEITVLSLKPLLANKEDSLALLDLYHATNGDNWVESWDLNMWVKQWQGVNLDDNGYVIDLQLYENNLNGELPASLSRMKHLEFAAFEHNVIKGEVLYKDRTGTLERFGMEKSLFNEDQIKEFGYYFLQDSFLINNSEDSILVRSNDFFNHVSIGDAIEDQVDTIANYPVNMRPYASEKHDGEHVIVPNRFLSNLPLIPVNLPLEDFKKHLHLIGSHTRESGFILQGDKIVKSNNPQISDSEGYGFYNEYHFEQGIQVIYSESFESGAVVIRYPEGGIFDSYDVFQRTIPFFPDGVKSLFYENGLYKYPIQNIDTIINHNQLLIELDESNGQIIRFTYDAVDCGDWYKINLDNGFIRVDFGGGC